MKTEGRSEASKEYAKRLRDPRWQKLRLKVMQDSDFTCKTCGSKDKTLTVHHINYRKGAMPWEYEVGSLACLCEECHSDVEKIIIPELRRMAVIFNPKVLFNIIQLLSEARGGSSDDYIHPPQESYQFLAVAAKKAKANHVMEGLKAAGYLREGIDISDMIDANMILEARV